MTTFPRPRRNSTATLKQAHPSSEFPKVSQMAIASCWVVAVYLVLKMFYLLTTGSAQPADLMLALLAVTVISPRRLVDFAKENYLYFIFLVWVVFINFVWAAIYFRLDFVSSASYYIFNMIVLVAVYSVRGSAPVEFDRIAILGLRASIIMQFLFVIAGETGRSVGTFNNPNQLAYWGVTVMSMYLLIRRNVTNWLDLPFLLLGTYCVVASLSRAGAAGVAVMLAAWFWIALKTPSRRAIGGLAGALLVMTAMQGPSLLQVAEKSQTIENFENRLEVRQDEDSLSIRNWDRVIEFYQYTIFGSGEGHYRRWEGSTGFAIEIHSTFFTLLFSYGVVGLGLFLGFVASVARRIPWSLSAYLLPSLFYGLSHQGLRFSFFWLLVGVMCSMAAHNRDPVAKRKKPGASPSPAPELSGWQQRGPEQLRKMARQTTRG